jgi:hypothetical protein
MTDQMRKRRAISAADDLTGQIPSLRGKFSHARSDGGVVDFKNTLYFQLLGNDL